MAEWAASTWLCPSWCRSRPGLGEAHHGSRPTPAPRPRPLYFGSSRWSATRRWPPGSTGRDPAPVQRWVGSEHEDIGDVNDATIDIGGVELTWGQVVAIAGDQYGTVEELRKEVLTEEGKARLRHRLEHAGVQGPIDGGLQLSHPDDSTRSNADYQWLALENVSHFAAGGTALETWRSHHSRALAAAIQSGLEADPALWQEAQLVEAFGQHFLTDMFAAGHVRTPRKQIIDWYTGTFMPRALPAFSTSFRRRLVEDLTNEVDAQLPLVPRAVIRAEIETVLSALITGVLLFAREQGERLLGLGLAGAVSGTLHDRDNERGIWVASGAHPEPWFTYGDHKLGCSPESRDQARAAAHTARERLVRAQALGRTRREQRAAEPSASGRPGDAAAVPGVVHFGFDSSDLDARSAAALDWAAAFLTTRPEQVVEVVGHTDPLGTDSYNVGLGGRRAEAVHRWLVQKGVDPSRIAVSSAGESLLVTDQVAGYPANRRCELHFRAVNQAPPDLLWAQQALAAQFAGPPYTEVERYLPREVPERNEKQGEWRWGALTSEMAGEVDAWVRTYVGPVTTSLVANPALRDWVVPWPQPLLPVQPVTIRPRAIVERFFGEFLANPVHLLGQWFGEEAGANATVPPPKRVPCPEELMSP